jgi:hypothetical protein
MMTIDNAENDAVGVPPPIRYKLLPKFRVQLLREAVKNSPDDIFIAVMGLTGAGKSTFVTECTGEEGGVGHTLESCTGSCVAICLLIS